MIVKVKYQAWSNINYNGVWEFDVDDDWNELDEDYRNELLKEMVEQKLGEDIEWGWEE